MKTLANCQNAESLNCNFVKSLSIPNRSSYKLRLIVWLLYINMLAFFRAFFEETMKKGFTADKAEMLTLSLMVDVTG